MKHLLKIFSLAIILSLTVNLTGMPASAAYAASSALFADNFEGGFSNWTMDGLWNPESETDTCGALTAPFPSPSNTAYFGQDGVCTYATGSQAEGALTLLTPVSLPATGVYVLSFHSYEQTENAPADWDYRFVEISTDGGNSWASLGRLTTEGMWYQKTFDLSPYLGQSILIRFRFNSLDGEANNFLGWMVDDVEIAPATLVTYLFEDFENGYTNWSMTGLWNPENEADVCGVTKAPFPSPSNAPYYGQDSLCNYDTGTQTTGSLTLISPITLPAASLSAQLTFQSFEQTEKLASWDLRYVEVSTNSGATWIILEHLTTEDAWYQKIFDLSPYIGQSVLIRFRFDSLDGESNNFFGWMVDDIQITSYLIDPATMSLSATSHDFGDQIVGTTSGAFTFTVTNSGAVDLNIGTLSSSGEFSISSNLCNGVTLAPAGKCTFDSSFSPLSSGAKVGSISIPSNALSSPDIISLSGNGIPADTIAPTVLSVTRVNPDPTSLTNVDFTVTFSEAVTGVDMAGPAFDDLTLTTTGVTGASITGVNGSGTTYTVTVNTGSVSGTIRLDVGTAGSVVDAALNPLAAGFASGEVYTVIKTPIFSDVPFTYWANSYIERLYMAGITNGCGSGPLIYCPEIPATRAQLAIMLLRGMHGRNYAPPPATGTRFNDVPLGTFGDAWIEELAAEGISNGCGNGNFCPSQGVTRAQMAILLVRATHGVAFVPATATGSFSDVPVGSFGADYIEQLVADGVTNGCGNGKYCPATVTTRTHMAIFLVKAFNLP